MAEKSYFRSQLDSAIQETEKLLKMLHSIAESRDLETALELSVTAAKISEGVALKTRALPAHTCHPRAERAAQEAISESVPVDIRLTEERSARTFRTSSCQCSSKPFLLKPQLFSRETTSFM